MTTTWVYPTETVDISGGLHVRIVRMMCERLDELAHDLSIYAGFDIAKTRRLECEQRQIQRDVAELISYAGDAKDARSAADCWLSETDSV